MIQLPHITIDWISFAIGFVSACIFWLIIWGIRKITSSLRSSMKESAKTQSIKKQESYKEAYLRSLTNRTLRQHLAFQLFSLEEILIEPRVIAPPPVVDPQNPPLTDRITDRWIPYIPEHPEVISQYTISTFSLPEAIQNGGNYFLYGRPGTGKSIALTSLAYKCSKLDPSIGALNKYLPVLLHINEINFRHDGDVLDALRDAVLTPFPRKVHNELSNLLNANFRSGNTLLLLDGVDELSTGEIEQAGKWIERFTKENPGFRVITTAFGNGFEYLVRIGLEPLVLAAWGPRQAEQLFSKWLSHWPEPASTTESAGEKEESIDKRILNRWLVHGDLLSSPLEWTLKIWSFLANDARSDHLYDLINSYLSRIFPVNKIKDIETCASNLVLNRSSALKEGEFRKKLSAEELADLTAKGFFDQYGDELVQFANPVFAGFFARDSIPPVSPTSVQDALDWSIMFEQYRFCNDADVIQKIISSIEIEIDSPAYLSILAANSWFTADFTDPKSRNFLLKTLYALIKKEDLPISVRLALIAGCGSHKDDSIPALLKQLLRSTSIIVKQAAAIAIGGLRDERFIDQLLDLLSDPSLEVRGASLLALSQFTKASATNAIIDALLTGDETVKLLAAEALTNNTYVGHEILKQSAQSKDFMVRRSVTVAIGHISADWVPQFLNKISVEDDQWIVRNAAANALETLQSPAASAPRPLPKAAETDWLIQCASNRGVGIPAGKVPVGLLLDVLKTGEMEERLAALDYLKKARDKSVSKTLVETTQGEQSVLREKAMYCLWYMIRSGNKIRSEN